jgi:anti-anti-sigma factor
MTSFRLTARDIGSPGYRLLEVHGELGLTDVDQLEAALDEAAAEQENVIVGLENCEFIDSMALAALVAAHRRFEAEAKRLVISGPTVQIRRALSVSGLDRTGFVFDSVEHALTKRP